MYAYCGNNPTNYYDPMGEDGVGVLSSWMSSLWWLHGADGLLPIGDIVYWGVAGILGVAVIGSTTYASLSNLSMASADTPELDKDGKPVVEPGQQPAEEDGYIAPKNGPVRGKTKDGRTGWKDKNGNIWVPAPTGTSLAHGGGHWDVESPGGGYTNVYPRGGSGKGGPRGGKAPYPKIPVYPK